MGAAPTCACAVVGRALRWRSASTSRPCVRSQVADSAPGAAGGRRPHAGGGKTNGPTLPMRACWPMSWVGSGSSWTKCVAASYIESHWRREQPRRGLSTTGTFFLTLCSTCSLPLCVIASHISKRHGRPRRGAPTCLRQRERFDVPACANFKTLRSNTIRSSRGRLFIRSDVSLCGPRRAHALCKIHFLNESFNRLSQPIGMTGFFFASGAVERTKVKASMLAIAGHSFTDLSIGRRLVDKTLLVAAGQKGILWRILVQAYSLLRARFVSACPSLPHL